MTAWDEFDDALDRVGSFERATLLLEQLSRLADRPDRGWRLLADHWDAIDGVGALRGLYLIWFRKFAPIGATPTEPITVYRGVTRPADGRHGISWTADVKVARRFAYCDRAGGGAKRAYVYSALAHPCSVLASFTDRKESEYVVEPWLLLQVKLVESGPRCGDRNVCPSGSEPAVAS
jgi:hypothetical protein